MIGRDASVPRSELANPAWRYVAMGHIHKHQSLNRDLQPPIIYSGSIERIDFGEEHEEKGFVVAEITDGPTTWDFIPGYHLRARPFLTIEVDVRGATDPTETIIAEIGRHGDLSKTVVKLIVQLRQEQEPLLVEREIKRALDDAYFVAAMQKDVQRTDRGRIGGISIETLTPQELLASYFEIKGVTPERTKLLLEHAQTLMQDDFTG
jgi:exonuclease SbcD